MLAYQAASWNDPIHIERWTDMQARIACYEHGSIIGNDMFWAIIEPQLSYPALWLAKNWNLTAVKKVSKAMERTYHTLVLKNSKISLVSITAFNAGIQTSDAALYEWLGITGGHLEADPLNLI